MVVFRHLMGTPHRKALFGRLNKLFDEKVLLGTGIATKEALRYECLIYFQVHLNVSVL